MKLIVGIGNPDPEYAETRHNVGWQFLDWLQRKYKVSSFQFSEKMNAEIATGDIDDIKISLIKPHSYVNESGTVIKKLAGNLPTGQAGRKLKTENLIVVHDDLDIPFGMCKRSFEKNSGGHKGVESIIKALKTTKFHRIRIGTGVRALDKAREGSEKKRDEFVKEYVLHGFTPSQKDELKTVFKECEVRLLQILK